MADLLRHSLRLAASAWLLLIAPLELASTLTRLLSRLGDGIGLVAIGLVVVRVLVVVVGILVGRLLWQRSAHVLRPALVWAVADLGTLAMALASHALPSNRAPGDGLVAFAGYAGAALIVVVAAQMTADAAGTGRD